MPAMAPRHRAAPICRADSLRKWQKVSRGQSNAASTPKIYPKVRRRRCRYAFAFAASALLRLRKTWSGGFPRNYSPCWPRDWLWERIELLLRDCEMTRPSPLHSRRPDDDPFCGGCEETRSPPVALVKAHVCPWEPVSAPTRPKGFPEHPRATRSLMPDTSVSGRMGDLGARVCKPEDEAATA